MWNPGEAGHYSSSLTLWLSPPGSFSLCVKAVHDTVRWRLLFGSEFCDSVRESCPGSGGVTGTSTSLHHTRQLGTRSCCHTFTTEEVICAGYRTQTCFVSWKIHKKETETTDDRWMEWTLCCMSTGQQVQWRTNLGLKIVFKILLKDLFQGVLGWLLSVLPA